MTTRVVTASQALIKGGVDLIPGLLLSTAVALAAMRLGAIGWFAAHGLSALTLAIVLGMLAGNTFYARLADRAGAGVTFSRQTLLRAGVILYGLRLTLGDVAKVGLPGLLTDTAVLASTFGLAAFLGTRLLRLDRDSSILIGAGSAICGAAAVMATEPVLRAKAERVTVAVATVVVFGTLATFLYPALYALNQQLGLLPAGQWAFGVYAGSTIHEVAQVVAAARSIGPDAANAAVIAKMVRVMLLAPFLVALSAWLRRGAAGVADREPARLTIPWFALGFIGVAAFNSLALLPPWAVGAGIELDTFLLAMAMAALGLTTQVSAIRRAGARPLILAALLFIWLIGGGALINAAVAEWF